MSITAEIGRALTWIREKSPLVHHITNYVTVNDCANVTLAIGASPIMADAQREAGDIAKIAGALVINMGTLNERTVPSMLLAGRAAEAAGVPVIFDPVGAGASPFRNETCAKLLDSVRPAVIRGNLSEIRFVAGASSATRGVDAGDFTDADEAAAVARRVAEAYGCTAAITGATDIVSDGKTVVYIDNGVPKLGGITGTGCMCSSLIGAFLGGGATGLVAAAGGIATMGIAGEIAWEKTGKLGNGSFRMAIIDAVSQMAPESYEKWGNLREESC